MNSNLNSNSISNNSIFNAEKRLTATDIVISNIKKLIISKKIQPGDRLPNETELAKSFSVSRGSVREAMKILSTHGIVDIKRGDGTYISDSTDGISLNPLLFKLIMNQDNIDELKELREMIEIGIINLAIKNRREEDILALENAYKYMEEKYNKAVYLDEVIVGCELMFHTALGQATRNKLVQTIYNFILELYIPNMYKDTSDEKIVREALECHRPIIDAIKEKDIEKGEKAIKYSVDIWRLQSEIMK